MGQRFEVLQPCPHQSEMAVKAFFRLHIGIDDEVCQQCLGGGKKTAEVGQASEEQLAVGTAGILLLDVDHGCNRRQNHLRSGLDVLAQHHPGGFIARRLRDIFHPPLRHLQLPQQADTQRHARIVFRVGCARL